MAQRKYYRETHQKNKKINGIFLAVKALGVFFILFFLGSLLVFLYYTKDFPRPEVFSERQLFQSTQIYDRTGKILLYDIHGEEKRTYIPLEKISDYLKQAVIATEDANFYNHPGVDLEGIGRAILIDLKLKEPLFGGSTIPQQLIRSSFLPAEKTAERKTREIVLALELNRRYSKNQILEWYLNQVPFGFNCYGAEAAAQTYFQKPASEISLAQAAVLAALIKAPSRLSLEENKEELLTRKDYVLTRMTREDYITQEMADLAKQEKNDISEIRNPIKAPHFTLEVKNYLIQKYGENYLSRKGLRVFTTLDWELQEWAESIMEETTKINKGYNAHNASLVAINPWTGEILAMIGSKDYWAPVYPENCDPQKNECLFSPHFNVATQGKRQPGSAFKPFVYLTAFEKGFNAETVVWDVKTNFETGQGEYVPENYDKKFRGPTALRNALAQSINVSSIKVLYLAGGEEVMANARKMGITTLDNPFSYYGLPLVLGGGEVNLLEMVSAYGVFATEGYKVSPSFIVKIEDSKGNIIEENKKEAKKLFQAQSLRLINDILSDNQARSPIFGTNSPLYFKNYQVAAKTGTTQNFQDGWALGYTPSLAVGVWVGNNDNSPMAKEPAVVLAGPIFHQFMEKAFELYPPLPFEKPAPSPESSVWGLNGKIDPQAPHSILHYIKKEDPLGDPPINPESDPQYLGWEKGIKEYLESKK